ncbi:MAG: hypothetical protein RJB66_1392 [Pseudomonadota bacterium]|jgi:putative membrane protein
MHSRIPFWAKRYLNETDLKNITALITRVEQKTQVELVPLVVRSSFDLRLYRGFLFALSLSIFLLIHNILSAIELWENHLILNLIDLLFYLIVFSITIWGPSFSPFLRFFFGTSSLREKVFQRACYEFFDNQLQHTKSRTAVLFMYSVYERKAHILPDPSLSHFPQALWDSAMTRMITSAKGGHFYAGFADAIEYVADELAKTLPPGDENRNEVPDHVIIKD